MFKWLDTRQGDAFARELADFMLTELQSRSAQKTEGKFSQKAERALLRLDGRIAAFKAANKLNFYQRSKLANNLLWALRDGGCPPDYAKEVTEWVALRL